MNLTRREALVAFAVTALAGCTSSRPKGLLGLTAGLDLTALAKGFQAAFPKDAGVEAIVAALPDPKGQTQEQLREAVEAKAREDFAAGRTFLAEGWVVSKTEGALATLARYDALIRRA